MTTKNTFDTVEELLQMAKKEWPYFSDFTAADLIELGVERNASDGLYHKSNLISFVGSQITPKLKVYDKKILHNQDEILNAEFPILNIDPVKLLDRTAQIEAYNFSILSYGTKFRNFISSKRKNLGIPDKGFKSHTLRMAWFKAKTRHFYKLGYIEKPSNINAIWRIINSDILRFLLKNAHFKRRNPILQQLFVLIFFDYLTLNDPLFSISQTHQKDFNPIFVRFKFPLQPGKFFDDNLEINIGVYKDTTKEEVKKIIDYSWNRIEAYKKSFPISPLIQRVKDVSSLRKKLKAYSLYIDHYTNAQIATLLHANTSYVRKIISDMKKEIRKAEKAEALR